ncbi:MAG: glycoside hydrolase family 3 C-terminal domain-containing protein [Chitinispirillaceae bacterium]|nr:glycoside hydrolase family 3 C-terminal domain-containing protein [Chitinispirillaceae bacterium]
MKHTIFVTLIALLALLPAEATRVSNVKVDLIKGTVTGTEGDQMTRFYMGRLTYTFLAEGKDSIFVDFVIKNQATGDAITVIEKVGDIGLVKQRFAADTAKTVYFRAKIVGTPAAAYVATVSADANMSKMWLLADSLVQKMTVQQRASTLYATEAQQWFGGDNMTAGGTMIVGWRSADGPHGVRWPIGPSNEIAIYGAGDTATLFPCESSLGCTWDTSLVRKIGQIIGKEARAMGRYCILGPMSDLVVNPRWGRAFETMGEDPYLVGKMASRQIMGLQSERVIATPKHFTPYVKETERQDLRVVVSERALRELFCVPFEMGILEGQARALMTCYNKVSVPGFTNDIYDAEKAAFNKHLVDEIVRGDWGFDGVIMSDWAGINVGSPSYIYSIEQDMDMPYGTVMVANTPFIADGTFSQEPLNRKAKRVMYGKLWAWGGTLLASDAEIKTYPKSVIISTDHLSLSLEAARKGIVLAKNSNVSGAPLLPLSKTQTYRIAVVGPYANIRRPGGGGSSAVTADRIITPLEGIQQIAAALPNVTVTTDYASADVAVVVVGVPSESEDMDRTSMQLPADQLNLVATVMAAKSKTIVVYTGGSASIAGSWSDAPAVLIAFYPGRWQGQAIAEVLFGDVNPSGHLNVTFPQTFSDLPSFDLDANKNLTLRSADTAHGYFFYEKTGKKPLFWFGHGLSYTTFHYNNMTVRGPSIISSNDRVDIEVAVKNTGTRSGGEVVQLYVKPIGSSVARRIKDLRGFSRISLEPNEHKIVTFTLGPRDFSIYDVNIAAKTGQWRVIPGTYEIIISSTSNPEELVNGNGKCLRSSITIQ